MNKDKTMGNSLDKQRLVRSMDRKFRTTFIGDISAFEESFGFLWGHGKHERDLSREELRYRSLWEEVRNRVLKNGNNQLRAAQKEIEEYNIEWKRYHMDLPYKNIKEIRGY